MFWNPAQTPFWYSISLTHLLKAQFVTDYVINNDQSSITLRKHYVTKKSFFWHFHFIDRIQFASSLVSTSISAVLADGWKETG